MKDGNRIQHLSSGFTAYGPTSRAVRFHAFHRCEPLTPKLTQLLLYRHQQGSLVGVLVLNRQGLAGWKKRTPKTALASKERDEKREPVRRPFPPLPFFSLPISLLSSPPFRLVYSEGSVRKESEPGKEHLDHREFRFF